MFSLLFKRKLTIVVVLFFLLYTFWYVSIHWGWDQTSNLFSNSYGIMALFGGIVGIFASRQWGGYKSILGKSILFFSLGLLFQEFGQLSYAFYIYYLDVAVPYPSIGDIGYFGSIPLYIYAVLLLGRASGMSIGIRSFRNTIQAILVPLAMLFVGYWLFLLHYEFDWSMPLTIFLDFAYPLAQSIYISLAILIYLLSRNVLGGVMRPHILFILVALLVQFVCDYTFLYQVHQGTWAVAGINDYLYLISYSIMTLAIISFQIAAAKIANE